MSDTTSIEWATATWNPWEGCTKVSPGCSNCYAAARNHRFGLDNWGKGKPRRRTSAANWKKPLAWEREERESKDFCGIQRPRIFPSLCDWLDDEVPIEWLADFLKLIHDTPNLDWLLLTKRPENWASRIEGVLQWIEGHPDWGTPGKHRHEDLRNWLGDWFVLRKSPANVWPGASVENQRCADERIPELLKIPAQVRFLSVEPLLEEVDLSAALDDCNGIPRDMWVIVGGESGPGARRCDVQWVRSVVVQCKAAGVPCFVKQMGSRPTWSAPDLERGVGRVFSELSTKHTKGGDPAEWPADLRVREFPNL